MPRDDAYAEQTLESLDTYEAFPMRCHACRARDLAEDQWIKEKGSTAGLRFGLRRRG